MMLKVLAGALAAVLIMGLVRYFRPDEEPRKQELMPAGGVCADCDRGVPLTTKGTCAVCGSSSAFVPWSHAAKLTLKERHQRERRRFRRGGIAS